MYSKAGKRKNMGKSVGRYEISNYSVAGFYSVGIKW